MTEGGATVGSPELDQASPWLKALLDHQTQSLQVMLVPVITHITAGDLSAPSTSQPLVASSEYRGEMLRQPLQVKEDETPAASWEMPVGPRDQAVGPFAAELEVINTGGPVALVFLGGL